MTKKCAKCGPAKGYETCPYGRHQWVDEKECDCSKLSCDAKKCMLTHTHKTFWCEKCRPEHWALTGREMEEMPKTSKDEGRPWWMDEWELLKCNATQVSGMIGFESSKDIQFISKVVSESLRMAEEKEIVICAAIKCSDGTIVRGHRHGNAIAAARDMGKELWKCDKSLDEQQGFVTSRNRYVTRIEGRRLQDAAGIQSADPGGYRGNTLFSEDLY